MFDRIREALAHAIGFAMTVRYASGQRIDQELVDAASEVEDECLQIVRELDSAEEN